MNSLQENDDDSYSADDALEQSRPNHILTIGRYHFPDGNVVGQDDSDSDYYYDEGMAASE